MTEKKEKLETKQEGFPNTTNLLLVLIALLMIFSVVQTFQLVSLNDKVNQQNATILELQGPDGQLSSIQSNKESSSNRLPSNLVNLPNMVGGC